MMTILLYDFKFYLLMYNLLKWLVNNIFNAEAFVLEIM